MRLRTKTLIALAVVAAASVPVVVMAVGDPEAPISGPALERASHAAVEHVGGGRVTGTEVGDEESRYEVEVTLPDGRHVDVQLDESFAVVAVQGDAEAEDGDPR